jgi:hypothetical protein
MARFFAWRLFLAAVVHSTGALYGLVDTAALIRWAARQSDEEIHALADLVNARGGIGTWS